MIASLRMGGLCLLTSALFFGGVHLWWPLVFVSLSPLAVCFCTARRWWTAALWAGLTGTLMFYTIQFPLWVYNHGGIFLLSIYQSGSVILMALGTRALWRRWKIRLVWIWPLAVVSAEYLRVLGWLGVPFGSLAGCCRDQTWLLQVCDLGGIYTLSAPIAMVQGLIADGFLRNHYLFGPRRWAAWVPTAATGAAWAALAVYAGLRLDQIESAMRTGPRVAVIQPDVAYVAGTVASHDPYLLLETMQRLTEQAIEQGDPPDLVVWPEAISSFPLHSREYIESPHDPRMDMSCAAWERLSQSLDLFEREFARWVTRLGIPLVVGMEFARTAGADSSRPFHHHNAAQFYDPDHGQIPARQFKMRLYPGGESFPWAGSRIDRWVSEKGILPSVFGVENRFEPGRQRKHFHLDESAPESPAYAIPICSEILTPMGAGVFEPPVDGRKPFDFLVNIANEGSFLRNTAQIHQFAYLPIRAIESRVGIARSSNTGISGFVSPTGELHGLVRNEKGQIRTGLGAPEQPLIRKLLDFRRAHESDFAVDPKLRAELDRRIQEINGLRSAAGIQGFRVEHVYTYPGRTLYQRFGDWLGIGMLTSYGGLSLLAALSPAPRPGRQRSSARLWKRPGNA